MSAENMTHQVCVRVLCDWKSEDNNLRAGSVHWVAERGGAEADSFAGKRHVQCQCDNVKPNRRVSVFV